MSRVVVEGKILRWGNSYGIRIRKADLERSDLEPGDTVSVRIEGTEDGVELGNLPTFNGGQADVSQRHDEVLAQGLSDEVGPGADGDDETEP